MTRPQQSLVARYSDNTYLLHDKSSPTVVAILQSWVQNQARSSVKRFCTDRGQEYLGLPNVTRFLWEWGIVDEQIAAHSSSSNGVAERMNRILFDIVRSRQRLPNSIPLLGRRYLFAQHVRSANPCRWNSHASNRVKCGLGIPQPSKVSFDSAVSDLHASIQSPREPKSALRHSLPFLGRLQYNYRRGFSCFVTSNMDEIQSRDIRFIEGQYTTREEFESCCATRDSCSR
jgi:hypothetical protein